MTGVTGMIVQYLVEEQIKVELECVTILRHNSEEMIARLMDPQMHKPKDAMKTRALVNITLFSEGQ